MMTVPNAEHRMREFDIKSRERLVRVEEGVIHIKELLEDHIETPCTQFNRTVHEDIIELRHTQKWIRWMSKTIIGGAILSAFGYVIY